MPWWAELYDQMATYFPRIGRVDDHTRAVVARVIEETRLNPGDRVLDLGCGKGRHVVALAETGRAAVGLDLSVDLVAAARDQAAERGEEGATFVAGDMREPPVEGPFAAVICMDAAIGVFDDDDDVLAVLRAAHARLEKGGHLLVEAYNPYAWAEPRTLFMQGGDRDVVRTYRLEPEGGRVRDVIRIYDGGAKTVLPTQSLRAMTPAEWRRLLDVAGFVNARFLWSEGWDPPGADTPFSAEANWVWVIAQHP